MVYALGPEYREGLSLWFFFFSSRRRHTRYIGDWSSDVCSSDLVSAVGSNARGAHGLSGSFCLPEPGPVRGRCDELRHIRRDVAVVGGGRRTERHVKDRKSVVERNSPATSSWPPLRTALRSDPAS